MGHVEYLPLIDRIAEGTWGHAGDLSVEEVEKHLLDKPEKLAAFALVELVRKLRVVFKELASETVSYSDQKVRRGDKARKMADVAVGDILYAADAESGLERLTVSGRDHDGFAIVSTLDIDEPSQYNGPYYVYDELFLTPAEAIEDAAKRNLAYHAPRYKWGKRVLAAIAANGDLSEFFKGYGTDPVCVDD